MDKLRQRGRRHGEWRGAKYSAGDRGHRVVISNVFADDNRGGAAITAGTIQTVRAALTRCDISLVSIKEARRSDYRHTLARHPDVELLPPLIEVSPGRLGGARAVLRSLLALVWRGRFATEPTVNRIRDATLVIGKGGQVFNGARAGGALAGFWLTVFPLILGRRLGARTALHAITVGPYRRGSAAARLAGWVLRRVDLVLVRDAQSYREARTLGVPPERLEQVPDVVFWMEKPEVRRCFTAARTAGFGPRRFGAVTITSGADDEELFETIEACLRQVLEHGVVDGVAVVLQTHGRVTSDRAPSEAFVRRMDDPRVRLVANDLSPQELVSLYGAAAFTLGCRLHSTLFSVIGGTPAYPISRTGMVKASDVFQTLGLERFVVRLQRGQGERERLAERLAKDIQQSVSSGQGVRQKILAAAQELREGQAIAVDCVRTLVRRMETCSDVPKR